jgi:hypothetical protein
MFTTAAVVSSIGTTNWLKWRTDEIRAAKLVAFLFLAAILIVIGVIADRMEIIEKVMVGLGDAKPPAAPWYKCQAGPGATWVICEQGLSRTPLKYWGPSP